MLYNNIIVVFLFKSVRKKAEKVTMKNERVAVLDVRSFEVNFLIGTKGFNDSFVICGEATEEYEGYSADGFLDEGAFVQAVHSVVNSVLKTYKGKLDKIYVGTPSAFVQVRTVGQNLPFSRRRKISPAEVEMLFDCGQNEIAAQGRYIRHSAMYFAIGNTNKYFSEDELYGTPSSSLRGGLCYYFAKESFCLAVERALGEFFFKEIVYLPTSLAEATYLLGKKERAGYAILLDVGYLTSTVSVVYGNGIVHEKSFTSGIAEIIFYLIKRFDLTPEKAEKVLSCANIAVGDDGLDEPWTDDENVSIPVAMINDVIEYGVDQICDKVNRFLVEHYKNRELVLPNNTIWVTGEGVDGIKGICDHISRRLEKTVEPLCPDLAYNDKPSQSSKIALLAMAISDRRKKKAFKLLGGK